MNDAQTRDLLLNLLLYVMLPVWGVSGFIDWCCHRATKIETTSGLRECMLHLVMGVQVGVPIMLSLFFEMNVLVMLVCFVALICHEVVAHYDVHYTTPRRKISIWEVHAHNYLATIPFYMAALVVVLNWEVFLHLIYLDWANQITFVFREEPVGGTGYVSIYLIVMCILCYLPYCEELLRCIVQRNRVNV